MGYEAVGAQLHAVWILWKPGPGKSPRVAFGYGWGETASAAEEAVAGQMGIKPQQVIVWNDTCAHELIDLAQQVPPGGARAYGEIDGNTEVELVDCPNCEGFGAVGCPVCRGKGLVEGDAAEEWDDDEEDS